MRIGFDATLIAERKSGIGHYSENLLRALVRGPAAGSEVLLLSNRRPVFDGPAPPGVRWVGPGRFPSRALWMQLGLPVLLPGLGLDLVHWVNFNAPAVGSTPYVVTFHDLALRLHPELFGWKKRVLTRSLMPRVARRARALVVVSRAVRDEALRELEVAEERVHVVHNAAGEAFRPIDDPQRWAEVRARYALPRPFVLAVGTLEPRKNLPRLLVAFDRALPRMARPHDLVLVGARGSRLSALERTVATLDHPSAVRFLDYVPTEDLPALYSMAELFVFPSLYEGFGIPLVEAMRCGAPVLASDLPVHREVLGSVGDRFDPRDEQALSAAIVRASARGGPEREALRRESLRRGEEFSWDRAARETWSVYEQAIGRSSGRSA